MQRIASSVQVTNAAFLRELAQAAPKGSCLWVCHFKGEPREDRPGIWAGEPYSAAVMADRVDGWNDWNTYFSVAALLPDENGEVKRRKSHMARMLALVADDLPLDDITGAVSYVIATSPGKHQVGIFLDGDDDDAADKELCDLLLQEMVRRQVIRMDKSGNNAVRYVRLPIGENQKPRDTGHFRHQVVIWSPNVRFSLGDAAATFGIDLDELKAARARSRAAPGAGSDLREPQADKLRRTVSNLFDQEALHDSINEIAASGAASGAHSGFLINLLRGLMDRVPPDQRTPRWQMRYGDIPRAVETAIAKYSPQVQAAKSHDTPHGLRYIRGDQIDTGTRQFDDEIIEGVLGRNAMAVIYGDSNSGKTFLAIDMAASIERGVEWLGRRTVPGLVIYLATEAPGSVETRIAAYRRRTGALLKNLVVVQSPVNLYDNTADMHAVIKLIREIEREHGQRALLIVGDTLARLAAGANENSGEDMTVVLRNADTIREETGASFLWIHHTGKDAARGARGWSGLRAAIDTEVEVTVDEATNVRTAEITKQRDLPGKGERFGFVLQVEVVGKNRWGIERTSCIIESADAPQKVERAKKPSEIAGAITEFLTARGAGCKRGALVKHFDGRYPSSSVYRELGKLMERGMLVEVAGIVALPGRPVVDSTNQYQ
jgi:RecA-family ATPase